MPLRSICCLVLVFVFANAQENGRKLLWNEPEKAESWKETPNNFIDIDFYNNDEADWEERTGTSGSGSGTKIEDTDDEDLLSSGSGSGYGRIPKLTETAVFITTASTTTASATLSSSPHTPCEQLRESSKHLLGNYVPRCTASGDYDSLQCRGYPGTGSCWCTDLGGREIPGTALSPPSTPDCNEGSNLPPCVFKLVQQSRSTGYGAFRPKCTLDGTFEAKQCSGNMCFCVDKISGVKIPGTEVYTPDDPKCEETRPGARTTPEKGVRKNTDLSLTLQPPTSRTTTTTTTTVTPASTQTQKTDQSEPVREPSSAAHVMTQPGILAAIIGGCVVLLLCAILLVMFIVYRMRKKDEGSYALDEPKKMPNYSYQRAPDKEFYA